MDPFIAYDAGFYMPPGGMFESFGQDEPLSNYMSPPASTSNSKGNSVNTSAASGLNMPQGGNGPVTQPGLGFPWGMPTMDLDQDWSWFMNDVQNWQQTGSQAQSAGTGGHTQFGVLP